MNLSTSVRRQKVRPLVVLARTQHVEVGDAVFVEHDCLPVDHEMLLAQLRRGLDDQREVRRPIMAASADQAHAVRLANDPHSSPS
jgi:hypothetical protein